MQNIPTATKNLLLINIIAYFGTTVLKESGIDLTNILGLHFFLAKDFHLWQLVTYMFMHGGLMHIFMNMLMLFMFGRVIEQVWGTKRYLIFYFVCGIGAGICQEITQFATYYIEGLASYDTVNVGGSIIPMASYLNNWTTVGASGAVYGLLLAFAMMFPNERMFIFPIPFPIKAKWMIVGAIAMELFYGLGANNDGIAHMAHLGGMLFGFILIKYWNNQSINGASMFDFNRIFRKNPFGNNANSHFSNRNYNTYTHTNQQQQTENDWDYNLRKKKEQEEIDTILDKIRKSGYDSLSKEEKQKLFDQSKK